jgi:4-diphosphocytidyl-2-C-methyl-D-erythritol kinase
MDSPLLVSLKKRKSFYGSEIDIVSPAKINLYLNCIGKYPQSASRRQRGYHRLESILERISLCDLITIQIQRSPRIDIFCNDKALMNADNLCVRAAGLLRKKLKVPFGFKIFLKKNIPAGSGLGGASSNAAGTLLGIDRLLNSSLSKSDLYALGSRLGSDVNFFLSQSSFAFIRGRGERVEPFSVPCAFRHIIVWPGIHLSTREVYGQARVKLTKFFSSVKILQYALGKADVVLIRKSIFNFLEKSAVSACGRLADIKQYLHTRGIVAAMTGSGSAFYTIERHEPGAKLSHSLSARTLKKMLPRKWLVQEAYTF